MIDEKTLLGLGKSFLSTPKGKEIIAKAEDVKGNVEDFQATKEQLEKYKPVITTFTTKGRLYSEQTSEPIQGVEVQPLLVLFPMKLVTKTRKIKIDDPSGKTNRITGKPKQIKIEEEYKEYVYDKDGNKTIKTDENGEYEIRFGTVSIEALPGLAILEPTVFYKKDQFAPDKQSLITLAGEVPQILPIKKLINIDEEAERRADQVKNEMNKLAETAALIGLGAVQIAIITIKAQILSFAGVAQNKLFPLAISLMVVFGITKLEKEEQETAVCPNNELLRELIKRRNSIVKQINQMWVVIAANTAIAAIFLYLSIQLKGVKSSISALNFPVASPPGVGVPYSLIAKLEDVKELLKDLVGISEDLKKALLISLIFLVISLIIILRYLKRIDELIENCGGDIPMEEINAELLAIQANSQEQGNPILTNVNGFELSVIQEDKFKVGNQYRRRAIAKNSGGITILQGEPSFSAQDQILLDELSFYIVQNNLKAD
tara:strand:+ start:1519 stop:2985 length:1467 start_codon:yes stop_codon:yes gene_type:complete